ncbi:GPI mannosyltransferase 2 [Phyllosticta citrichinensis]|uniref:GPI mannosyltransferase 2 n=1 Tax=Phyllosticta citrichinensis TaxID=1130410 RepID=A0ABR1XZR3_9PEZI
MALSLESPIRRPLDHAVRALLLLTVSWKILLLSIAFLSPGPGYDSSSALLLQQHPLALRLTRWDAVYFASSAARDHVYEQEWAFSWLLSRLISITANSLPLSAEPLAANVWAATIIANASHLLSVLALYHLMRRLFPASTKIPFLTAALHVLSPAGLFLTAPYGEAPFSLLNFLGLLSFCHARQLNGTQPVIYLWCMLTTGLCFGLATAVRSNGLLNGLILLYDAPEILHGLLSSPRKTPSLRSLAAYALAGVLTASGLVVPQWIAYQHYCTAETPRPWCNKSLPSIYTFVQHHYWNVGFLRYWTLSNVPLFLLAAPSLFLLISTGLREPGDHPCKPLINRRTRPSELASSEPSTQQLFTRRFLIQMALPQLALALLALTNFHVQIINRISSGYPLWYLAVAAGLDGAAPLQHLAIAGKRTSASILRVMVMYAIIQGALFASFLPPA